jgi:hypothetical protein
MRAFAVILDVPRPRLGRMLIAASLAVVVLRGLPAIAGDDAVIDCGTAALKEFESHKVAILTPKSSDSAEQMIGRLISIDGTIEIRRLEEGYCLRFAQCIRKPSDDPLTLASHFNSCVEDEETERVLDELRDRGSKAIEEFISRLKEE